MGRFNGRCDTGDDRDAGRAHPLARLDLRAHCPDRLGRWPDPDQVVLGARASELRILGEEAVAGMNRLRARFSGGVHGPLLVEIALRGRAAADQIRLVCVRDVRRIPVYLRVDADRPDPELTKRPEDSNRDLAPVGDKHLCENGHCPRILSLVSLPDVLTVARAASVPFVILLYAWNFQDHNYWATALFAAAMATDWFDGRIARSRGYSSPLGSLLDPAADKILVLAVLVMLVGEGVAPGWMVALIVVREFLVTALRLAALERGIVLHARDLGKLKTWSQAVAAGVGGFAAAGAWSDEVAWWTLLVAVVLTWISGLDYARVAPRLWRGGAPA
jgi:CDP-diacylglycerol--glycerol-3-phosphate 3-phosphatidyltransferase